jgi:2-dehydro-3-deoxyphosphogluconate aldolase/(4S)-4-hydroxy-2-oxoglutarate aldolase
MRGIPQNAVVPLTEAIISSGLKAVEITMNTPNASSLIKQLVKTANSRLIIGAGTVLTLDKLKEAIDCGATFIVSPTIIEEVVEYCLKKDIPVFPGALTPNEIYRAWKMGATMVKVFPAKVFGPSYFKEIKGPFDSIELLACGGVNSKTIGEYFNNGACACAFGGSVFKKDLIQKGDYASIEKKIKELISNLPK